MKVHVYDENPQVAFGPTGIIVGVLQDGKLWQATHDLMAGEIVVSTTAVRLFPNALEVFSEGHA